MSTALISLFSVSLSNLWQQQNFLISIHPCGQHLILHCLLHSIELCQKHCFRLQNAVELCQQHHMLKPIELCQRHCFLQQHCLLNSVELCQQH